MDTLHEMRYIAVGDYTLKEKYEKLRELRLLVSDSESVAILTLLDTELDYLLGQMHGI